MDLNDINVKDSEGIGFWIIKNNFNAPNRSIFIPK